MSAIAGILDLNFDTDILREFLSTMDCRGREGNGSYTWHQLCLLHTEQFAARSFAGMPMILDRGTERYVITLDGAIYNRKELRQELSKFGHYFEGATDGELVLHAYAQWKEVALEKMNGVFAFAILEEHSGRVFLARDRLGVKPLFYTCYQGGFLFASEMKTILSYPGVPRELDREGAAQLMLLGPGRKMESGVFRNISQLQPGCCGVYENGEFCIKRYWKLQDRAHTEDLEETAEHVRALVLDAIRLQMDTEKTLGTFLSGGLDSSLISAVCAREMEAKGRHLHTFSVDYRDNDLYFRPGKFQPNADTEYIRLMQSHLDTEHHWTLLSTEDLLTGIENVVIAKDLPGMADVDVSLLAFCKQISPHVQVALSGECADEIFGGYPWYRDALTEATTFPWARNTAQREALLHPQLRQQIDAEGYIREQIAQTLRDCNLMPDSLDQEKKHMMQLNIWWFMQTLLERNDRMSSFCGLEVRVPYCDYRIVEYLYGVPGSFMDYKGREKGLLRYAVRDILPDTILYRKKSPYPKTHHPQYEKAVKAMAQQLLANPQAPVFQLVDHQTMANLLEAPFQCPWYGQLMQLPQTLAYLLQLDFWLRHYGVQLMF